MVLTEDGGIQILDGGMGTEIQRRVDIEAPWWGNIGFIQLSNPQAVVEAHSEFVSAGSDVLITNTYCTNRNLLYGMLKNGKATVPLDGLESEDLQNADLSKIVHKSISAAVAAARKSAESADRKILIAGSVGNHNMDADQKKTKFYVTEPDRELENFKEAAEALIDCKVDMLFLELLTDIIHAPVVMEAVALATKQRPCPIYLGFTCFQKDGKLLLKDHNPIRNEFTAELLTKWLGIFEKHEVQIAGINVMHTPFADVLETIQVIKQVWTGTIGCYPDSGVYRFPDYEIVRLEDDVIREYVRSWVSAGVTMVGGCCGVTPDVIEIMADTCKEMQPNS